MSNSYRRIMHCAADIINSYSRMFRLTIWLFLLVGAPFKWGARCREQVLRQPWLDVNIVLKRRGNGLMPPLGMPLTSGLASGPSSVQHLLTPLYQFVGLCYHRQQGEYTKPTFPGGPHPKDSLMRNVKVIVLGCDWWFQGLIRTVGQETLGLCLTAVSSWPHCYF